MRTEDLKIEAVDRQNKGGQCVGVITPAVKVTHMPTGITAQCATERSQLRNKRIALAMVEYGLAELGWMD